MASHDKFAHMKNFVANYDSNAKSNYLGITWISENASLPFYIYN